jgi:hypothetical protein
MQVTYWHCQLGIPQIGLQELEQVYQQPLNIGPALLCISYEQSWHETPMTHQ